jgi:metal-responsive CopG/Arc/MetJ family transcriptional regulator
MIIMINKAKRTLGKVRSSISFPQDIYTDLEKIAYEKKVSLAWVVRDAVEIYLKGQRERKNVRNI